MKKNNPIISTQNTSDFPGDIVENILNTTNPSIAAVKELDGKIFALLDADEMRVFDFYREKGRKFGVSVSVINEADPAELARAKTQEHADQIMKRANSLVSVAFSAS
jgi:hypothetical protein